MSISGCPTSFFDSSIPNLSDKEIEQNIEKLSMPVVPRELIDQKFYEFTASNYIILAKDIEEARKQLYVKLYNREVKNFYHYRMYNVKGYETFEKYLEMTPNNNFNIFLKYEYYDDKRIKEYSNTQIIKIYD